MDYILKPTGSPRASYIDYLLNRLTEFRRAGRGFGQKHAASLNVHITRASIRKQLGCSLDDESRFDEICAFIKGKIDNTILGRNNAAKGRRSYHSFEDHGEAKTFSPQRHRAAEGGQTNAGKTAENTAEAAQVNANEPSGEKESLHADQVQSASASSSSSASLRLCGQQFNGSADPQRSGGKVGSPTTSAAGPFPQTPDPRPQTPSEKALTLGAWRARTLKAARPFLAAKISQGDVASAVGTSAPTLCRLLKDYGHLSDDQLTPENCAGDFNNRGRASDFEMLLKVTAIVAEMNRLYTATIGASCDQATRGRRTGSIALTLKRLGDFPTVPEHLAAKLRAGSQPKPFVEFLKRTWTPEIEAKYRGQKHYSTATISGRRELVEELSDGTRVPLKPGRVWVLDDMSSNIPFWFEVDSALRTPHSALAPMIHRHGCAVGRQGLYAWDWATGAWLGLELVGRLRDAYTASDILRFLRKLMMRYGKPDKIVIEQGVWKARSIAGWKYRDHALIEIENDWQVGEMLGDETARITDGIRAIGVEIIYAYTPRGKPIEGAFNYHQRIVPTFLQQGEAVNIGRHAGEFEWAAKQARRAADGVLHARDLGFIHMDRLADVAWQAMLWEGTHDKSSRNGKPIELLAQYLGNFPMPQPTQRDLAVFLPEKRSRIYKGGSIIAEVAGDVHEFLNPEVFTTLPCGTKLDFAFDPSEPTLGAAIYDARGFLCWADYLPAGPAISARDRSDDAAPQLLKRYKLAHRTAARMLDLATLRTVRITESRSPSLNLNPNPNLNPPAGGRPQLPDTGTSTQRHRALHDFADDALLNVTD